MCTLRWWWNLLKIDISKEIEMGGYRLDEGCCEWNVDRTGSSSCLVANVGVSGLQILVTVREPAIYAVLSALCFPHSTKTPAGRICTPVNFILFVFSYPYLSSPKSSNRTATASNRYDKLWNRPNGPAGQRKKKKKNPRPQPSDRTPKPRTVNLAECWPNITSKASLYHPGK